MPDGLSQKPQPLLLINRTDDSHIAIEQAIQKLKDQQIEDLGKLDTLKPSYASLNGQKGALSRQHKNVTKKLEDPNLDEGARQKLEEERENFFQKLKKIDEQREEIKSAKNSIEERIKNRKNYFDSFANLDLNNPEDLNEAQKILERIGIELPKAKTSQAPTPPPLKDIGEPKATIPQAPKTEKAALKTSSALGNFASTVKNNLFTKQAFYSLGTGVILGATMSAALSVIGLGAATGVSMSLYRSIKGEWQPDQGFLKNVATSVTHALAKKQTYAKLAFAAGVGVIGVVGGDYLIDNFLATSPEDIADTSTINNEQNVTPQTPTATAENTEPTANPHPDINANSEPAVISETTQTFNWLNAEQTSKEMFIIPGSDLETLLEQPTPEIATTTGVEISNPESIYDLSVLLDGSAANDPNILSALSNEAEAYGVDPELIKAVDMKLDSNFDFVMTADAINIVSAYAESVQGALENGELTGEEYRDALTSALTALADENTNLVVDVNGQADDIESYVQSDKLSAVEAMRSAAEGFSGAEEATALESSPRPMLRPAPTV